ARDAAILAANRVRLRPILMTTVMLVFGMVPIALGRGPGSGSRGSIARVIIGGQALSLLITLLITPVAYSLFDDLGRWLPARVWVLPATSPGPWRAPSSIGSCASTSRPFAPRLPPTPMGAVCRGSSSRWGLPGGGSASDSRIRSTLPGFPVTFFVYAQLAADNAAAAVIAFLSLR